MLPRCTIRRPSRFARLRAAGLRGLVVVAIAARYKGYRYPIEVIGHAVGRFTVSR